MKNIKVYFKWSVLFVSLLVVACSKSDSEKGFICLQLGDYERAIRFFDKEVDRKPYSSNARTGLGKALLQRAIAGKSDTVSWREALVQLESARSLDSSVALNSLLSYLWNTRARQFLTNKDTFEALNALSRAIEYDPGSLEPLNLAGIIYFRTGEPQKARVIFHKSLQIDNLNATAYFNLGMVNWHDGDVAGAHTNWLRALEIVPNDQDVLYWFALSEKRIRDSSTSISSVHGEVE